MKKEKYCAYTRECIKEVEQMSKHPLSQDEFTRQIEENRRRSELRGRPMSFGEFKSTMKAGPDVDDEYADYLASFEKKNE